MKPQYREGQEATENFERGMKALFQAPKAVSENKGKKQPTTLRKTKKADKD